MKKIYIITHYWKKSSGGGVLTYIMSLVSELERKNIPVKVLFEKGIDKNNYHIEGSRFLFPFKALKVLKENRPEIVHSQNTWYCLLSGYIYKKLFRARLVHTFHTSPSDKLSIGEKLFFQFLLNRCDCVTFVSDALKTEIQNIWKIKFKNTAITYAGVYPGEVTNREITDFRNQFDLKDNFPILLAQAFTANKLKSEGAKLLIQVVKIMRDIYPNIRLILTREGVYSTELKQYATDAGLKKNIVFTGDVTNPYIPIAICDVYTHISLAEGGLSLAILEAMVLGKPIVATNIGGIPEAITNGKNGILVEPNIKDIVKAIETLLKNEALSKELGENAKKRALEKFNWKNSAMNFINIYEDNL